MDSSKACSWCISLWHIWLIEGVVLLVKRNGPNFGYFLEPWKWVLVFDAKYASEAEEVFADLGIKIVCSHRLLEGIIGSYPGRRGFVEDLVKKWISELECLTTIASSQPQAAFAAFTKSLQFQWSYVQRVVGGCQSLFMDLETTIWEKFLPTVMGMWFQV